MALKTWQAAGADTWDTANGAPWGGTAPTAGDTVQFDATSVQNCSIVAIGTFNGTITVTSGYVGTITQNVSVSGVSTMSLSGGVWDCNGFDFSCGSAGFTLAAATWTQGSGTITTGAFVCNNSGGTINATSGTWNLGGSFTRSNDPTFTANGGTINVTALATFNAGNFDLSAGGAKVTVTSAAGFTISNGTTIPLGANPTSTTGIDNLTITGALTFSGDWTHTGIITVSASTGTLTGTSTPTLSLDRSLTVNTTSTITNAIGTITLTGTATATITDTGDKLSGTTFTLGSGSNKSITIAASTICRLGAAPTSNIGTSTLTVTGTVSWSGAWTHTGAITVSASTGTLTGTSTPTLSLTGNLNVSSTGTITNAIGTITLTGTASATITDTADKLSATTYVFGNALSKVITVAANTICRLGSNPVSELGTATMSMSGTISWSGLWTLTGGVTVQSGGTLTGTSTPTISMTGSLNVNSVSTITNTIGTITYTGTASPTFTDTGDKLSATTWVINKSSNSVTIAANTIMRFGADPLVNLVSGTLTVNGTVLWDGFWDHVGILTVGAAGTITGTSSPTLKISRALTITAGGVVTNPISTITFTGAATSSITDTTDALSASTWIIGPTTTNVTLTIAANTTVRLGAAPTVDIGTGSITVTGTLTWTGLLTNTGGITVSASTGTLTGSSSPSITLGGSLNVNATGTITNALGTITLTGGTAQAITDTGDKLSGVAWVISKSGGTTTVAASTTMDLGTNPSTSTGASSFIINGTLLFAGNWDHDVSALQVGATGTLTGTSSPTLILGRALTVTAGGVVTNAIPSITFRTGGTTTFTDTTDAFSATTFVIDKGDNSITIATDTICRLGASPTTTCGTGILTVTGTIDVSGDWTHTGGLIVSVTTGAISGVVTSYTGAGGSLTIRGSWGSLGTVDNNGAMLVESAATVAGITSVVVRNGNFQVQAGAAWPSGVNVEHVFTTATGRTLTGNGFTYGILRRSGLGSGTLTIASSNTFTIFRDDDGLVAHTLVFTDGTTQTIGKFLVNGSPSALVTLESSVPGNPWFLTSPNRQRVTNVSLQDSHVDNNGKWGADASCVDAGGNFGWVFTNHHFNRYRQVGARRVHRAMPFVA
jgi:fibronectin-binding autotransporter adhesin